MDYWLSKASETEAQLDQLRVEFEETIRAYKDRIDELERNLFEANLNAQTTGVSNQHLH